MNARNLFFKIQLMVFFVLLSGSCFAQRRIEITQSEYEILIRIPTHDLDINYNRAYMEKQRLYENLEMEHLRLKKLIREQRSNNKKMAALREKALLRRGKVKEFQKRLGIITPDRIKNRQPTLK